MPLTDTPDDLFSDQLEEWDYCWSKSLASFEQFDGKMSIVQRLEIWGK
jgi:hypothetical protein